MYFYYFIFIFIRVALRTWPTPAHILPCLLFLKSTVNFSPTSLLFELWAKIVILDILSHDKDKYVHDEVLGETK